METYTVKKINQWKNGKGSFIAFEERPETFYIFGLVSFLVGDKVEISASTIACGDIKDSKRIDSYSVVRSGQKTLPPTSAIVEAAKSTGAKLYTPVVESPNNDFLIHELLAKQAEKILEQQAVIAKLILRIDAIDGKLAILQNKTGVSFI